MQAAKIIATIMKIDQMTMNKMILSNVDDSLPFETSFVSLDQTVVFVTIIGNNLVLVTNCVTFLTIDSSVKFMFGNEELEILALTQSHFLPLLQSSDSPMKLFRIRSKGIKKQIENKYPAM